MKYIIIRRKKTVVIITGLFLLIFVNLMQASSNLQAQESRPTPNPKNQDTLIGLTPVMQAFLQDQQPVEENSFLAEIPCVGGFADVYPCNNVDLLAFMPLNTIGGGSGNDIWGWTDPANGKEYALMGRTSGTSFVDISDPENPIYLGNLPPHTSNSSWRDIKVYDNHAFIGSEASGHGLQVFDLTRLRTVAAPPVTFTEDAHYDGIGSSHNVVINEETGFAYAVGSASGTQSGCSGGLHIVDISTPTNPTFAGCFSSDGYTHDAQCVIYNGPDVEHIGKEICFNANEDTVTIVDVTNKSVPKQLSRTGYTGSNYTHQAWLSEDHSILFVNDETDEQSLGHNTRTRFWDVSDLDTLGSPTIHDSSAPAIDHNLYVRGNLMYQSNYRAGLRILDSSAADNGSLAEVAYFDIYPANDNPNFNGNWSNYPYFDSDNVIVSGIEQGLFILQPNMSPDFRMEATAVTLNICGATVDSTTFNLESLYGYSSNIVLSVTGVPAGATSTFSTNPVTPDGSSNFTLTNNSAAAGSYLLQVTGSDGSITADEYLKLTIAEAAIAPALVSPANNATDVSPAEMLTWTAVPGVTSYDVEVATDPAFSNIVASASGISDTSYAPSLNPTTQYYWRVRTNSQCGSSVFSSAFSFTTTAISCTFYPATDLPLTISPVGTPTIQSNLTVSSGGSIVDVNVLGLNGTHTYISDLDFNLASPAATSVQIMAPSCGNLDNFSLSLDDQAAPGPWPCPPTDNGTYQPSSPLAAFNGEDSTGTWTLTINDNFNQDGGSLNRYALEICTTCSTPTAVTDVTISTDGNNIDLNWTDTGASSYDIWRSNNDPYFTPGPDCSASADCTTVTTNSHSDNVGIGNTANNYSYLVVARTDCAFTATPSNLTGEFDFELSVGSP